MASREKGGGVEFFSIFYRHPTPWKTVTLHHEALTYLMSGTDIHVYNITSRVNL